MRSREELKTIAQDLLAGKIFASCHVERSADLPLVFMPLGFLDEDGRKQLIEDKVVFVFEYLSKAGPRSCNGMPMFTSFQWLNEEELKTVSEISKQLEEAINKI